MINRSPGQLVALIMALSICVMTLGAPYQGFAADLTAAQLPSAQSTVSFSAPDTTTTTILRDAGLGLGVGVAAGVLFSMMSGGNFSQPTNMIRSDAFGTALFTGLIGGVITGIWQAKKARAEKAALSKSAPAP